MSEGAVRVDLPSGGWWELEARPAWARVRLLLGSGPNDAPASKALVRLTSRWSFPEPVSERSLLSRDDEDVAAALQTLNREVLAPLRAAGSRESAEALFFGIVGGSVPAEFVEVCLMAATGWSWRELSETPADVVIRTALLVAVRDARERGDDLDLWRGEEGRPERTAGCSEGPSSDVSRSPLSLSKGSPRTAFEDFENTLC